MKEKPLPREVVTLGWISLLTDVAGEMLYPIMPLFLLTLTGAPGFALGLIEGTAEAMVAVMKGLSGWHSDRIRRRVPYVRWGYGSSAFAKPVMALAWTWGAVYGARLLDRLGKGLRSSARDALLADAAEPAERGRVFGYHRGMDTAGAAIGVFLASAMLWLWPGQYRLIIMLTLLPGLGALALTMTLHEPAPHASAVAAPQVTTPLGRSFWLATGALVMFGLANSSDTFLLLRARAGGWADWQVGLAYTLFNVTYSGMSYPLGRLSDRVGRWPVMACGWVLYAAIYAAFAALGPLWPLFALYGLYMALTEGVGKALVADLAPAGRKGTAMGIVYTSVGFANLAGSLAAGLLWDRVGQAAPFWLGSGLAAGALVVLGGAWAVRRLADREGQMPLA